MEILTSLDVTSLFAMTGVLFIGFLYLLVTGIQRTIIQKRWESTPGIVIESELLAEKKKSTKHRRMMYFASVKYQYSVNGQPFESTKVRHRDLWMSSKGLAKDILKSYPSQGSVDVFFNPDEPSLSLLECESGKSRIMLSFLLLLPLIILTSAVVIKLL